MTPSATEILRLLTEAAAEGKPCPTTALLARIVGVTEGTAEGLITRLKRGGYIRVENFGRCVRTITIVTSGHTTGPTTPRKRKPRLIGPQEHRSAFREAPKRRVMAVPAPFTGSGDGFIRPITKAQLMARR